MLYNNAATYLWFYGRKSAQFVSTDALFTKYSGPVSVKLRFYVCTSGCVNSLFEIISKILSFNFAFNFMISCCALVGCLSHCVVDDKRRSVVI